MSKKRTSLSSYKIAGGVIFALLGTGLSIAALVTTGWLVDGTPLPTSGQTSAFKGYGLWQICMVSFLSTAGMDLDCQTIAGEGSGQASGDWTLTIEVLFTAGCACMLLGLVVTTASACMGCSGKGSPCCLGTALFFLVSSVVLCFFGIVLFFAKFIDIYTPFVTLDDAPLTTNLFSFSFGLAVGSCVLTMVAAIFVKLSIEDVRRSQADDMKVIVS